MTRIDALDELGRRMTLAYAAPQRRPRRRLYAAVALACAAVATPALAAVTDGFDFGRDDPKPPPPVKNVPRERTLDLLKYPLWRPEAQAEIRRKLKPYGMRLIVRKRPVADAAVGRLLSIQDPDFAHYDTRRRLILEKGLSPIIITIGRAARPGEHASTRGLSLYEVLPQVEEAVDIDDPRKTGRRLAKLGFTVHWKLIVDSPPASNSPTGSRSVTRPPEGTRILSVLNANGGNSATRKTRSLLIEVTPPGSKIARSHP